MITRMACSEELHVSSATSSFRCQHSKQPWVKRSPWVSLWDQSTFPWQPKPWLGPWLKSRIFRLTRGPCLRATFLGGGLTCMLIQFSLWNGLQQMRIVTPFYFCSELTWGRSCQEYAIPWARHPRKGRNFTFACTALLGLFGSQNEQFERANAHVDSTSGKKANIWMSWHASLENRLGKFISSLSSIKKYGRVLLLQSCTSCF